MTNVPKNYNFKFVKNPDFRTVKADGVYGGVTVRGEINMNFYVDTIDLPKNQLYSMDSKGAITKEIPVEKKAESIRELITGINMDLETTKSVILWLNDKVKQAEATILASQESKGEK